jgi:stage V sporulation protein G
LNITEVRVRPVKTDGKTRAIASITFDNEFVVKEVKVVEGPTGLFVSMPCRKVGTNGYRDIAHPITKEAREEINKAVMAAYQTQANPQAEAN